MIKKDRNVCLIFYYTILYYTTKVIGFESSIILGYIS